MCAVALPEVEPRSQPRRGVIGVAVVDDMPDTQATSRLRLAVTCPSCGNYATVEGSGNEYGNVTTMLRPTFECSTCSFDPSRPGNEVHGWKTWYQGRLRGTMLWAVNEDHLAVLEQYLETNPKRRPHVQFDAVYLRLMQRLPPEIESGRSRSEAVSMVKRLIRTRPR